MIFWYFHFAEPQKRYYQKMPPVLCNNPYQNILNWLWNDSWTNYLLMTAELECHSRIELVNETQLRKVQMKRPTYGLCFIHWATTRMRYKHGLKTNHRFGIQLTTYMGGFICTSLSWLSITAVLVPNAVELEWHLKWLKLSVQMSFHWTSKEIGPE